MAEPDWMTLRMLDHEDHVIANSPALGCTGQNMCQRPAGKFNRYEGTQERTKERALLDLLQ